MYHAGSRGRDRALMVKTSLIPPLQTEGMDLNQPPSSGFPSSGYLTPSSSAYEGRRDSIASMQSSASCAHSFSSNASSYYSTQMPPTPHSSREALPDDWMMVGNSGLPFENATSQDTTGHELDDYNNADAWSNSMAFASKGRTMEPDRRPQSWVLVEPAFNNALRIPGSDTDGMVLPASRDFTSSFESSISSQATRALQPAPEIYSSSDLWNAQHAPTSGFAMQALTSEAYEHAPLSSTVNIDYEWPVPSNTQFDLPMFHGGTPDLAVQPEDTIVEGEDKSFHDMRSDSFDDNSFGSFDGYSSSTSQCSRYGNDAEPRIKEERDSDFPDRSGEHPMRDYMSTPMRKNSRKDPKRSGAGITKRKLRCGSQMQTMYRPLGDCPVEVKYQAGIQVDPKSGRYCSASGETKKQRCRFEGCVKTFARPEHLKRHENTHSKERPFPCVVPHCGRRFSRNDNRKAHYETHLKEALLGKKARNAPVSFEDLCRYLHSSEPEEEARKMIEKLQNPKSKVKSRE